jgi:predicted permease
MNQSTISIINRVLPILILLGLGYGIRRRQFLSESAIDDLRKIAVNLALPSVLFISFLQIELRPTYFVVFAVIFVLCIALFGLGKLLHKWIGTRREYFPFLMTGFEYGMLGVSLFGSAYGLENIGYIAIVDLGHEIFIWFVFLALLLMRRDELHSPAQLAGTFFKSPVIIAILAGILFNILGVQDFLYNGPVTGALIATLEFLSNLVIPLILIIVGYGIKFDRHGLKEAALVIVTRLALLIPLALALNHFLLRGQLDLGKPFEVALFTLLILPPPFIIPLYMPAGIAEEKRYVNNVLMLYTVISIVIFTVYFIANPAI